MEEMEIGKKMLKEGKITKEEAEEIKNKIYEIKSSDDNLQILIEDSKDHRITTDIFLTLPADYIYQGNVENINGKIVFDGKANKLNLSTVNGMITANLKEKEELTKEHFI